MKITAIELRKNQGIIMKKYRVVEVNAFGKFEVLEITQDLWITCIKYGTTDKWPSRIFACSGQSEFELEEK